VGVSLLAKRPGHSATFSGGRKSVFASKVERHPGHSHEIVD